MSQTAALRQIDIARPVFSWKLPMMLFAPFENETESKDGNEQTDPSEQRIVNPDQPRTEDTNENENHAYVTDWPNRNQSLLKPDRKARRSSRSFIMSPPQTSQ